MTTSVAVSDGKSCYDESLGLKINKNETLTSFFSKFYPRPLNVKLKGNDVCSGLANTVFLGRDEENQLAIRLRRTLRMPVDGKIHNLPPGLGSFPLFNVDEYKTQLPPRISALGGIFFPMYRRSFHPALLIPLTLLEREAMWISFTCQNKFVVRPFLGGVNGISGESMVGNMTSLIRKLNNLSPKQDYLILPDQPWLDGVAASPGQVKQFVAVPMPPLENREEKHYVHESRQGSSSLQSFDLIGKSVEFQITGKEEVGGIQLEIIPEFEIASMFFSKLRYSFDIKRNRRKNYLVKPLDKPRGDLEPLKTPAEQLMKPGSYFHMRNLSASLLPDRPKQVGDLLAETGSNELGAYYPSYSNGGNIGVAALGKLYITDQNTRSVIPWWGDNTTIKNVKKQLVLEGAFLPSAYRLVFDSERLRDGK